jgi:hypothetical protein
MYKYFVNFVNFFFKKNNEIHVDNDIYVNNYLQKEKIEIMKYIIDMEKLNDIQLKILHSLPKDSLLDILKVFSITQNNLIEILNLQYYEDVMSTDEVKKE